MGRIEKQCGASPRLRAGSDAYPGSRHTVLIAKSFYLHKLQVTNRDSEEACHHWSKSFFKFLPVDLGWQFAVGFINKAL